MATITKTFTENSEASYKSTWTLTFTASDSAAGDLNVNLTAKYVYADKKRAFAEMYSRLLCTAHGVQYVSTPGIENWQWGEEADMETWWSGYTRNGANSYNFVLSDLFTSANPTVRTLPVSLELSSVYMGSAKNDDYDWENTYSANNVSIGNIANITLNAPPTFTASQLSFDTPYIYAGLTTASVTISNAAAKFGGNITASSLTIGDQTVTGNGNGTLSILLNNVGTFTPVLSVTDSRGQITTQQLDPITVSGYNTPTVSFTGERTTATGTPDDEGTYATLDATFIFTDIIATLQAPSVTMTDQNGTQTTPTVTWYSTRAADGTLSGSVNWSSLSNGDTVYCLVPGLNTQYSYDIAIRPRDNLNTGTAISQTIGSAFYTVDFLAGGHGIAFGQPASQAGFFCNMDAHFKDANSVMRALFDFVYPVGSYYETSDTTFDPNVTWGGTWELEAEGQVHVSAGSNYTVAGALTNITDGGEATHTLIESELPQITGTARVQAYNTATASGHFNLTNKNFNLRSASSGTANAFGSVDLNLSFGSNGAHNNMQPYIIVKRWHRTA